MRPVLIVTHLPDRRIGLVGDSLRAAGCQVIQRNSADAAPLPALDQITGIVSLGGRQSAITAARDPFLSAELALIAGALQHGIPVLGMCLGSQLLAVAAGGTVTHTGRMYAGWPELVCAPATQVDPVFGALPSRMPVLKWHEDAISLPPGADMLGRSEGPGAALFRIGAHAWGSQAHLELTPEMLIDGWLSSPEDAAEIEAAGHRIDEFRARSRRHLVTQMAAAGPMFTAFGRLAIAGDTAERSY